MMANQPIGQIMFIDQFVGPLLDAVVGKQKQTTGDDLDVVELTEWPDSGDDVPSTGLLELEFCRKVLRRNRREWERKMAANSELMSEGEKKAADTCAGSHVDPCVQKPEDKILENASVEGMPETSTDNRIRIQTATRMASTIFSPRRSSLPTISICLRPSPKEAIHSTPPSPSISEVPISSPISRHSHQHHSHAVASFFPHTDFHNPSVSPVMSRTAPMNAIVMGPFKGLRHNMATNIGPGTVRYAYGSRGVSGCGLSPGMADKFGFRGFGESRGEGGGGRRGSLPNYTSNSPMEFANAFASFKFQGLSPSVFVSPQCGFPPRDNVGEPSLEAMTSSPSKMLRSFHFPTTCSVPGTSQQRYEQNLPSGPHPFSESKISMPMESEMSREYMLAPNNNEFNRARRKSIPPDWPL